MKTHRNLVGGKHRRLTHVKVSRCEMLGDYMLPTTFYKNLKKNPFMTAVILNYPKLLVFHCHLLLPSISKNPGPWVGVNLPISKSTCPVKPHILALEAHNSDTQIPHGFFLQEKNRCALKFVFEPFVS